MLWEVALGHALFLSPSTSLQPTASLLACLPLRSLDDVVMGGVSASGFRIQQGAGEAGGPAGIFAGSVTTANNGAQGVGTRCLRASAWRWLRRSCSRRGRNDADPAGLYLPMPHRPPCTALTPPGGFASVRCRNLDPPLDLSAYDGLELRVRGNGLRYKCILRTTPDWDSVGYTAMFDTTQGEHWHAASTSMVQLG